MANPMMLGQLAMQLRMMGWPIKTYAPRDERGGGGYQGGQGYRNYGGPGYQGGGYQGGGYQGGRY